MKYWGKIGAFWDGFWGLPFGSAAFAIPGIGPILVAGPLVGWIIAGLEGAVVVGGVSAVGAGQRQPNLCRAQIGNHGEHSSEFS
jgi:hypothetical protein